MKLLVLGGTIFVGRHVVEAARQRGHEVTLFNRGLTNPHLFPQLEKLRGDRDGDLAALQGRRWDAVVDTSGELPGQVSATATLLADSVGHYTVFSSIMVYSDFSQQGIDEDSPVEGLKPEDDPGQMTHSSFSALKVLCEHVAEVILPGRALCVRAGLPVGPYDFTDRLAYWPRRVAQGGQVLAPGRPDLPVQFIDARDLADWIVRMAEAGTAGVYNATGPDYPLTLGQLLETCKAVSQSDAAFTWVSDAFLLGEGLLPLYDLPLWIPEEESGLYRVSNRRAIAAGLTFRPLADTLRDILLEDAAREVAGDGSTNGRGRRRSAGQTGIARAREAALLRAWGRRGSG